MTQANGTPKDNSSLFGSNSEGFEELERFSTRPSAKKNERVAQTQSIAEPVTTGLSAEFESLQQQHEAAPEVELPLPAEEVIEEANLGAPKQEAKVEPTPVSAMDAILQQWDSFEVAPPAPKTYNPPRQETPTVAPAGNKREGATETAASQANAMPNVKRKAAEKEILEVAARRTGEREKVQANASVTRPRNTKPSKQAAGRNGQAGFIATCLALALFGAIAGAYMALRTDTPPEPEYINSASGN
jgi:hypothetical protein